MLVLQLQQVIAILVITIIALFSLFKLTSTVKIILSALLTLLTAIHYMFVLEISRYVNVAFLPLFIVESAYIESIHRSESVFYVDLGQISLICMFLMWRKELVFLIHRWLKCACTNPSTKT